jgi:hypothetical protein
VAVSEAVRRLFSALHCAASYPSRSSVHPRASFRRDTPKMRAIPPEL